MRRFLMLSLLLIPLACRESSLPAESDGSMHEIDSDAGIRPDAATFDAGPGDAATAPDAGHTDAAHSDAAMSDAASADAADELDAGASDAGRDAGPALDAASQVDAATPDAHAPDAFVPDAYVPDAFVPDAFVADAFMPPNGVECGSNTCEVGQVCCIDSSLTASCLDACPDGGVTFVCDGPEDCSGNPCCGEFYGEEIAGSYCTATPSSCRPTLDFTTMSGQTRGCHINADCTSGVATSDLPHCCSLAQDGGSALRMCFSSTIASFYPDYGITCP